MFLANFQPTLQADVLSQLESPEYVGADTMDHVLPRSRGGATNWMNAVAAHRDCNRAKGDRTPEEAGMPLLWRPWKPSRVDLTFSAI